MYVYIYTQDLQSKHIPKGFLALGGVTPLRV